MSPIIEGDYPELIKTVVAQNSEEEGLSKSRLPDFTDEEKAMMKGSYDFVALNYYTSYQCTPGGDWSSKISSFYRDIKVDCSQPDDWEPGSGWLRYTPWGMQKILNYIKDRYGNPPVIITENGYSDGGELKDEARVKYHRSYLDYLLNAVLDDKCNVFGYTAWSFLDDFEWSAGYLAKFGLMHVDFNDDARPRTRKYSSYIYEHIIATRQIDWDYNPDFPPTNDAGVVGS
ncbi:hypothetical protein NQ317_001160 [Molorchus minor]|uniref:Uncharacterized protein n=1 Tax=Molorchus minor TaxID=1323400 RepID=A0ABQ9JVE8_9CUCU|nr:hypothetical protein NQ317_001160 [Molorchus minor]